MKAHKSCWPKNTPSKEAEVESHQEPLKGPRAQISSRCQLEQLNCQFVRFSTAQSGRLECQKSSVAVRVRVDLSVANFCNLTHQIVMIWESGILRFLIERGKERVRTSNHSRCLTCHASLADWDADPESRTLPS